MKHTILFLLLLTSLTISAHEDTYKAVEKSNVHITIQVGYESSWELCIVESYAGIINDFIREIDPTQKVFVHFSEDYCFLNDELFFIGYGDFKKFVPLDFPWGYDYDMKYINTQKGIAVIISEKYFNLKKLLQLIEFGLQNNDYVINKEKIYREKGLPEFREGYYTKFNYLLKEYPEQQSETAAIIDSIIQTQSSNMIEKYLSKKVKLKNIPKALRGINIELYLQNNVSVSAVASPGHFHLRRTSVTRLHSFSTYLAVVF